MKHSKICHFSRSIKMSELKTLLAKEDPIILELGAHNGSETLKFLKTFRSSFVHCFECDPRPMETLRQVVKNKDVGNRVALYEVAISDSCGKHVFFQSGGRPDSDPTTDWDYSSSLLEPTGHLKKYPWCSFEKQIHVNTVSLDSWYFENQNRLPQTIDLVWADLQGAEHLMIKGGKNILDRTRYLFCEYYDTPLYAGQKNSEQLFDMLGPNWQPLATYEGYNFLAINTNVQKNCPWTFRFFTSVRRFLGICS